MSRKRPDIRVHHLASSSEKTAASSNTLFLILMPNQKYLSQVIESKSLHSIGRPGAHSFYNMIGGNATAPDCFDAKCILVIYRT